MANKKADLIRLLEAELDVIEGGGSAPPAGKPVQEKPIFQHSLACINHWLVPGREAECNDDCILMHWVPEKDRKQTTPCQFIPLNSTGETVKSLEGDRERMEEAVKLWLRTTIERLKQEDEAPPDLPDVKF